MATYEVSVYCSRKFNTVVEADDADEAKEIAREEADEECRKYGVDDLEVTNCNLIDDEEESEEETPRRDWTGPLDENTPE